MAGAMSYFKNGQTGSIKVMDGFSGLFQYRLGQYRWPRIEVMDTHFDCLKPQVNRFYRKLLADF